MIPHTKQGDCPWLQSGAGFRSVSMCYIAEAQRPELDNGKLAAGEPFQLCLRVPGALVSPQRVLADLGFELRGWISGPNGFVCNWASTRKIGASCAPFQSCPERGPLGPPVPFYPFSGEGSPTKQTRGKSWYPYSNLYWRTYIDGRSLAHHRQTALRRSSSTVSRWKLPLGRKEGCWRRCPFQVISLAQSHLLTVWFSLLGLFFVKVPKGKPFLLVAFATNEEFVIQRGQTWTQRVEQYKPFLAPSLGITLAT